MATSPESSEMQALLARARAGDAPAREALAILHQGKLRFYFRARLGRALAAHVDVDDLLQETCLRAFRDLDQYRDQDGGGFYKWMLTIARHVLADVARAARASKRGMLQNRALEPADWSRVGAGTAGPRTRAMLSEQQQMLERTFLQLTPRERRLIVLRQLEARPAREVAAVLGMTELAVHAAYRRALASWERAVAAAEQGRRES